MPLAKPAHKTVCPVASTPNQPIPMAVFGLRFRPAYCRGRRASQAARHQIGLLIPAPNIRSARVWGASDYRPVHFPCFRGEASPVETHASGRWVFPPRTPSKNRVPQRQGSFSRLAMRKKRIPNLRITTQQHTRVNGAFPPRGSLFPKAGAQPTPTKTYSSNLPESSLWATLDTDGTTYYGAAMSSR